MVLRHCFACSHKQIKGVRSVYTLHKFPRNERFCLSWKMVCNLRKDDDVSKLFLCSKHFNTNDYVLKKDGSISRRLNGEAIPSQMLESWFEEEPASPEPSQYFAIPCEVRDSDIPPSSPNLIRSKTANTSEELNVSEIVSFLPGTPQAIQTKAVNTTGTILSTPFRKRKFAKPRYISENSSLDMKSPRRRWKCLKLISKHCKETSTRIKCLQKRNRHLHNHIKMLTDLISHFQSKNLVSEGATEHFLELPENIKHVV